MTHGLSRACRRVYREGTTIQAAYKVLRKAGEKVAPKDRMKDGFWIGRVMFVARGNVKRYPDRVFVEWWEHYKGGRREAQRIVRVLRDAKIDARMGTLFGRMGA